MTADAFIAELKDTLSNYRFDDVPALIEKIELTAFNDVQIKKVLNLLRRKRLFGELERVSSLFFLLGKTDPVIRRHWAQALLDQNRVGQALTALKAIEKEVANDPVEGPEIRGLIGRAFKQQFVNDGASSSLSHAIAAYRDDWHASPHQHRWHGINLVALLARAERDGIDPKFADDGKGVAKQILSDIEMLEKPTLWDFGTAMEAAVALGDKKTALRWAKDYATDAGSDAFELGSTLRQMKEVWQLEGQELGKSLLPVLEYELLQREGGNIQLSTVSADSEGFEAVYGPEGLINLDWLKTLDKRARAIARIEDPATGERLGTSFLLRGEDLNQSWPDKPVLITNSHVISDNPADEAPLRPGQGVAEFTHLPRRPRYDIGKLIETSMRVDLDFSVLEIATVGEAEPLGLTKYKPALPQDGETQRIYVIGHPSGGDLHVSLYDNNLAEYDKQYVRYRSPTEGGSSGSPVFNRRWDTFAIHHRARKERQLNEGVLIEAIRQRLAGGNG